MGNYGIEETKGVLMLVFSLASAAEKALKDDGKLTVGDTVHLLTVLQALPGALSGIESVPKELAELDDSEKADLLAWAKTNFDLDNDKLEGAIELGLTVAAELIGLTKLLKKDA